MSDSLTPLEACKGGDCRCGFIFGYGGHVHVATVHNSESLGTDHFASDIAVNAEVQGDITKKMVRAVNCHDELVVALEQCIERLEALKEDGISPVEAEVLEAAHTARVRAIEGAEG